MKNRKRPAALVAALLMILIWTTPAGASQSAGFLDSTDGHSVCGWAWDPAAPDRAVEVQISVKDARDGSLLLTQTCLAGQYREDLQQFGGGCHGFSANLEPAALNCEACVIEASCQGVPLTGTLYWQREPEATAMQAEPAASEASLQLIPLGVFRTTAYCSCRSCSGSWGRLTSTGVQAVSNHTAAVDPRVIPFGTRLMIDGVIYTAEDEGSGVNGRHIDLYCDTHAEAAAYGLQNREVYLVP